MYLFLAAAPVLARAAAVACGAGVAAGAPPVRADGEAAVASLSGLLGRLLRGAAVTAVNDPQVGARCVRLLLIVLVLVYTERRLCPRTHGGDTLCD